VEFSAQNIAELAQYFSVRAPEDTYELFLKPSLTYYTREQLLKILELVCDSLPDEASIKGDEFRLWWD
jgi:hypothetical protein